LSYVILVGQATPRMLTFYILPSRYSDYANWWSAGGVIVHFPAAAEILFEESRSPAQPPKQWVNKLKVPRNNPEGPEGGRGIALLFLDLGARRGGRSPPRPGRFTPGKYPVHIGQEAGWAPGPAWTYAKNLAPTGIRSPDRPARSQSLYRMSYPASVQWVLRLISQDETVRA
jgi:hypothetical protein